MDQENLEENRGRQILVGGLIITTLTVAVLSLLIGWRYIPGWVGEAFGMFAGIMSTPFFMEGSFIVIGFLIVLGVNTWRRRKEGDEFVEIETSGKGGGGNPGVK